MVSAYWWVYRFVVRLLDIPGFVWAFFQRGWRGYADRDLWSLDGYLSRWLPQALRQFARTTHSYPGNGMTDTEWIVLVHKMADGFEAHRRLIDCADERDVLMQRARYGMRLFVEWFGDLWD